MPVVAATGSAAIGFSASGSAVARLRATGSAAIALTASGVGLDKRSSRGAAAITMAASASAVAYSRARGEATIVFDAEATSPAPGYGVAEYTAALIRLAPRGRVWAQDPDSVQGQVAAGLAAAYQRSDTEGRRLLREALPDHARSMLPEWEATVGADPAAAPTAAARRRVVLARFAGPQGPSAAALQELAALFGLTLAIRAYAPTRAGIDVAGTPVRSEAWAHALSFDIGPGPPWAQAVVAERLAAMTPAHVVPLITFH